MSDDRMQDVTTILAALKEGDESAVDGLIPLVYDELRSLAGSLFQRENAGGDRANVTPHTAIIAEESDDIDLVAWDQARARLTELDERQGRIVELRVLAGLTAQETTDALSISARTVEFDSRLARAWLRRELGSDSL